LKLSFFVWRKLTWLLCLCLCKWMSEFEISIFNVLCFKLGELPKNA
jgi:hypothetical protein